MNNEKNVLINKIDVAYRELEDNDNQYYVMSTILNSFNIEDLNKILKIVKLTKKQYETMEVK